MHFGLILTAVGLFVGAANAQFPNIDQIGSELQSVKQQNNDLQDKITKLQLSLVENNYNNEQIKTLKEEISEVKLKCDNICDESVDPLRITVRKLESTIKIYKKMIANGVNLPTNPLETQLKNCQAQLGQPWSPLAGTKPAWINPAPQDKSNCVRFGQTTRIHNIEIPGGLVVPVLCDGSTAGPGWTVIQRRIDGEVDFYRNWNDYRNGFGNPKGEYFIGLENLHRILDNRRHKLYIHLEPFSGESSFALYDSFKIGNEAQKYVLNSVGKWSGTAPDKLSSLLYSSFSTYDNDNDNDSLVNSAALHHGGWWYSSSASDNCNLNGKYFNYESDSVQSIRWTAKMSLKAVTMLIHPV